ncbi:MAG: DUF4013 domain-containing protein [archaeon]|nr:DUF4013 domain-containing protein [archaeon]
MFFLILTGYYYRIIEKTIKIENKLPEYDNIFLMLIQGFKITIVEIIYQLIPLILLVLGVILLKFATGNDLFFYGAISLIIIAIILSLLMWFFYIMAINNFIANGGQISKALAFKEIWTLIKSVGLLKYLGTIILFIIIQTIIFLAIGIVTGILSAFSTIAGPFALFLMSIVGAISLVANVYCMIFIARGYALLYLVAQ